MGNLVNVTYDITVHRISSPSALRSKYGILAICLVCGAVFDNIIHILYCKVYRELIYCINEEVVSEVVIPLRRLLVCCVVLEHVPGSTSILLSLVLL